MKRLILVVLVAAGCLQAGAHAQQGGLNTPVLPGLPVDPTDPDAKYKSDILEQRQVEPDILLNRLANVPAGPASLARCTAR